jgi:hypothetical protein
MISGKGTKTQSCRERYFMEDIRACLNFILRFCYAFFFTAFCYKNAHLALPNSAFEAAISKKIAYNKFQK